MTPRSLQGLKMLCEAMVTQQATHLSGDSPPVLNILSQVIVSGPHVGCTAMDLLPPGSQDCLRALAPPKSPQRSPVQTSPIDGQGITAVLSVLLESTPSSDDEYEYENASTSTRVDEEEAQVSLEGASVGLGAGDDNAVGNVADVGGAGAGVGAGAGTGAGAGAGASASASVGVGVHLGVEEAKSASATEAVTVSPPTASAVPTSGPTDSPPPLHATNVLGMSASLDDANTSWACRKCSHTNPLYAFKCVECHTPVPETCEAFARLCKMVKRQDQEANPMPVALGRQVRARMFRSLSLPCLWPDYMDVAWRLFRRPRLCVTVQVKG